MASSQVADEAPPTQASASAVWESFALTEPLLITPALSGESHARRSSVELELIGTQLRAAGIADIGGFSRLTDYVNFLDGFFQLRDVTLLTRTGALTRVSLPELRLRLDEVTLVGQRHGVVRTDPDRVIRKESRRLVVMTPAHVIYGSAFLHEQASLTAFVDATDPPFIPMTNVRVRWLADRRLAGRYQFALLQRSHIIGVATEEAGQSLEA